MPQTLKKQAVNNQGKKAKKTAVAQGKRSGDGPVGKDRISPTLRLERRARQVRYAIIGLVGVIVLAIVGILYYQGFVEPYQRVVITVDETQLRMDKFLERTKLSGADPIGMTQGLTNEILIRKGVPQYGITVSPADVDAELKKEASTNADGTTSDISDAAFKEWYRQKLNQMKVSDATLREAIEAGLLTQRLQTYLGDHMSTSVPQVRVSMITVAKEDAAKNAVDRFRAGEDFGKLAQELSQDSTSRDKGGDLGWMPKDVSDVATQAFQQEVGKISDPIPYVPQDPTADSSQANSGPAFWYLLLVTEKSDARQVDDQYVPALKGQALQDWLAKEMPKHKIAWNLDSNMYSWIKYQLAKTQPASGQANGGQPSGGR